jgi:GNAT superfamily N-acetyltransferase
VGITAPEPLLKTHALAEFSCGNKILDDWLKKTALKSHSDGGSRTFVIADSETSNIIGYYCLSTSSIERTKVAGNIKRNMPDPTPLILLGRLAVDERYARKGLGKDLMKDCYRRVISVSHQVGVRVLVVHAIDDDSRRFYLGLGFTESPLQSHTLMIRVSDLVAAID